MSDDSTTADLFSYLKQKSSEASAPNRLVSQDEALSAEGPEPSPEAETSDADPADEAEHEVEHNTEAAEATALDFDDPTVGEQLRDASEDELNAANFGIIRLDDDGIVQFFNAYESNLSGVDREKALGQNYFNELAPCSNNRVFYGRFREGLATGQLDEYFTYTFTYKMRPTLVDVHLYRDEAGHNWIMVRKR